MKVLTWNLNHRIRQKAIPDGLGELFSGLNADVVLLNEFVDGPTRAPFRESLRSAGYGHQLVSSTPVRHNQVFAAARQPLSLGDLDPPSMDGSARSNFLHIRFEHTPVQLVGFRAPAYETATERRAYWAQLVVIMQQVSDRRIVFAGDINRNPFAGAGMGDVPEVRFAECHAYTVANPAGEWSYINHAGTFKNRIDHVLHTQAISVEGATYVTDFNGRVLAGPGAMNPISDHAALTFTVVTP